MYWEEEGGENWRERVGGRSCGYHVAGSAPGKPVCLGVELRQSEKMISQTWTEKSYETVGILSYIPVRGGGGKEEEKARPMVHDVQGIGHKKRKEGVFWWWGKNTNTDHADTPKRS